MEWRGPLPKVFDPTSAPYFLKPNPAEPSESDSESWPIPEDDIPHIERPFFRSTVVFTSSLSFDDLSKPSPVPYARPSVDISAC
jgi:hypothetical protein